MINKPIRRNENLKWLSREHHFALLATWKINQGIKKGIDNDRIKKYTYNLSGDVTTIQSGSIFYYSNGFSGTANPTMAPAGTPLHPDKRVRGHAGGFLPSMASGEATIRHRNFDTTITSYI